MAELLTIRRDIAEHIHFSDRSLAGVLTWTTQRLKVVDGSSINAPDTPENRAQYPQSEQQNPQCGFPLINLVGIFCQSPGSPRPVDRVGSAVSAAELAVGDQPYAPADFSLGPGPPPRQPGAGATGPAGAAGLASMLGLCAAGAGNLRRSGPVR
ncbi:MAG: hypothetical protein WCQ21_26860, partial [Verrucomicrobiota bacterium]